MCIFPDKEDDVIIIQKFEIMIETVSQKELKFQELYQIFRNTFDQNKIYNTDYVTTLALSFIIFFNTIKEKDLQTRKDLIKNYLFNTLKLLNHKKIEDMYGNPNVSNESIIL